MPRLDRVSFTPLRSLGGILGLSVEGRLRFPDDRVGRTVRIGDRTDTVFRELRRDSPPVEGRDGAVFLVTFRLERVSPAISQRFSVLPIPFFAGVPGSWSKLWLLDECAGVYEWASATAAEGYRNSFAMRFMTARAVPGSVSPREVPDANRDDVVEWIPAAEVSGETPRGRGTSRC
ncbi:MAG: hypothetical protein ACI9YT_002535 [Halobacteriales archaeon]|jgi:hypothetical protein